jgi:hypothetical protein
MRTLYEPQLVPRLFSCKILESCDKAFLTTSDLATLNRALPEIVGLTVTPGASAGVAHVAVDLKPVTRGANSSGIYDLRLFLNDHLVSQAPQVVRASSGSIDVWRRDHALTVEPNGLAHASFDVSVPQLPSAAQHISAYAFNSDRVKSDTRTAELPELAVPARPRRAYVVAVGIDNYDQSRLKLNFASSDAKLLSDRLSTIGSGYEVASMVMTSTERRRVTREAVGLVFGLLAGREVSKSRARLAELGFNADRLGSVGPDDLLIVTWSGHGWSGPDGQFYLVPTEADWSDGSSKPITTTLISADELTEWLSPINALEMALVIDACHSAASVDTPGFKPGPMGDRGLGQLAYDKGIRILAASQASQVALEDAGLGYGLLTYALAGEGIDGEGFGRADANGDGAIKLDEWLRYAVERLPGLSEDVRLKRFTSVAPRDFDLVPMVAVERPKPQEPALFDFNGRPSDTVLRRRMP